MASPRYIRLAEMVTAAIKDGTMPPGTRLPPHRAFAEKFNVALATATRAYGELERRGLIVGEAGRGTFVRDPGLPPTLGLQQTDADGLIDLVFNMPTDASDPDMLRAGLRRMATSGDLEAMLRYQPHGGRAHERKMIAASQCQNLGPIAPNRLMVTSGSQHGLAIIGLGLLRRGDAVAVDALTYPGFKSVAVLTGLDLVPIGGTDGVMDPDDLDRHCRAGLLRAVYLMPTVHNPLGAVMDAPTRLRLVEVARRHDLIVIEDATYAFLEPAPPPALVALAPERVIHVGGFSKSLATGLRLGYVIAPEARTDRLLEAIRATTWNAPALISGLVTGWIEDGTLKASEDSRRRDGTARQKICQKVLGDLSPLSHPNAGFAWLPLGPGLRVTPILSRLKERGISASGADPFATTSGVPQALRLAFGGVPMTELRGVLETVRDAVTSAGGA